MKVIRYDVDGIIRNFEKSVYIVLSYYYPNKTPKKQPTNKDWHMDKNYPKIKKADFYNLVFKIHASEIFLTADYYKGAHSFITRLKKIAHKNELKLIARTHQTRKTAKYTYIWLLNKDFYFDGFFSSLGDDKNFIEGILIDDKVENIKNKEYGILLTRDWNKYWDGCPCRANSYNEVLEKTKSLLGG